MSVQRPARPDMTGTIAPGAAGSAGGRRDVAILLGTYQGAEFLGAQLDSIARQTHDRWRLWASDDGSTDDSVAILRRFAGAFPGTEIDRGPRRGFAANFLHLLCDDRIEADFFSFCDQDDIWHPDKLARAVAVVDAFPHDLPVLYGSRISLIDRAGAPIGLSPLFRRPPSFENALTQNIANGNTMVMNRAARDVLRAAGPEVAVPYHDWWAYILVSAAGGAVIYDPVPSLLYRLHGGNAIGLSRRSFRERVRLTFGARHRTELDAHLAALDRVRPGLTERNRHVVDALRRYRTAAAPLHLMHFMRSGLYRQTGLSNAALVAAAAFRTL